MECLESFVPNKSFEGINKVKHHGRKVQYHHTNMEINDILLMIVNSSKISELKNSCQILSTIFNFENFEFSKEKSISNIELDLLKISNYPTVKGVGKLNFNSAMRPRLISDCIGKMRPLIWSEALDLECKNDCDIDYLAAQIKNLDIKNGISYAIHLPNAEIGIFSLATTNSNFEKSIHSIRPYIMALTAMVSLAAYNLLEHQVNPHINTLLKFRERDCLQLCAQGKTSQEIAQSMSLTARTVDFHISNAVWKLDVRNRMQAIAKAMALGLIEYQDYSDE